MSDSEGWVCNSCGSMEFSGSVSEDAFDDDRMSCGKCGSTEFHWEERGRMSDSKGCEERIKIGSGWNRTYAPCGKPAKVDHDGKRYCGIHDPVKKAKKRADRDAKWDSKREREHGERQMSNAAPALYAALEALIEMHDAHHGSVCSEEARTRSKARAALLSARPEGGKTNG